MNTYEITFITKADTGDQPVKATIEKFGGKILNVSNIGERQFTYPIKKENRGVYTTVFFEIPTDGLPELNQKLSLEEEILRFLIIAKKPVVEEIKPAKAIEEVKPEVTKEEKTEEIVTETEEEPVKEVVEEEPIKEEKPAKKEKKVKEVAEPTVKPEKTKVTKKVKEIEDETETEEDRLKALDKKLDELLKD